MRLARPNAPPHPPGRPETAEALVSPSAVPSRKAPRAVTSRPRPVWPVGLSCNILKPAIATTGTNSTEPMPKRSRRASLSTAAGGLPAKSGIGSPGAYFSDALLLLFGIGSVLFVPVVAIAGLRMLQAQPTGQTGRGLLVAAACAFLLGTALGLTSASAGSRPSGRMGGAFGLAAAHGINSGFAMIHNPQVAGPARFATLLLLAIAGSVRDRARPHRRRAWLGGARSSVVNRARRAAPRTTQLQEERPVPVAQRHASKAHGCVSEPAKTGDPRRTAGSQGRRLRKRAWRSVTTSSCRLLNSYRRRRRKVGSR